MSMQFDAELDCPACGSKFTAKLYRTIWGEYPENRALVMQDKINVVTCPHCGKMTRVIAPLFYTNSRQQFAVWYEPYHDPMIDNDAAGYARIKGPNFYLAAAPRIADWEEFKAKIEELEQTSTPSEPTAEDMAETESFLKRFLDKFKH